MSISYDMLTGSFLAKITEFEFIEIDAESRTSIIDGYMRRAVNAFKKNCKYSLHTSYDDENRVFAIEVKDEDVDEIVDILSEGMVAQWLKTYLNRQELLESTLNTRDYTTYSPAELLRRVGEAYDRVQRNYTQMIREYSFNHGDLSVLHQ